MQAQTALPTREGMRERESQMGDISRMASCSAGKCSAAVLRSRLETCKDERAKSLLLTALLLSLISSAG